MSTAVLTQEIAKTSSHFETQDLHPRDLRVPNLRAHGARKNRAGAIYLLSILAVAFAEIFIRGGLSVAGGLAAVVAMIGVTLLFFDSLSQVSRRLLLVAACFNLVGLAVEVLRLQPQGENIAVVFNGFFCILIGHLALRSNSPARFLGALMALGGLGWLTLLSPAIAHHLSPYNLALAIVGEAAVCLWLLLTDAEVTDPA